MGVAVRSKTAKCKNNRNTRKTRDPQNELQHARAFDLIVRDLPTEPVASGRPHIVQERAGKARFGQASTMIQQLYRARQLAEETRDAIEKRIKELRRQMRRATAA
jgi:hypothetical protein